MLLFCNVVFSVTGSHWRIYRGVHPHCCSWSPGKNSPNPFLPPPFSLPSSLLPNPISFAPLPACLPAPHFLRPLSSFPSPDCCCPSVPSPPSSSPSTLLCSPLSSLGRRTDHLRHVEQIHAVKVLPRTFICSSHFSNFRTSAVTAALFAEHLSTVY